MPAKKQAKINLLPQKEFETSTLGRLLRWALSSFRIIVIVTEMFVMGAFLSRFWLDAKNSDLNELLDQKKAVIAASAEVEKEFKDNQKRLTIFSKITSQSPSSETIQTIASFLPPEVSLTSVSLGEKLIQISGSSANEMGIAQFIANLESSKKFKEVGLAQVGSDKENQTRIGFSVKVTLN